MNNPIEVIARAMCEIEGKDPEQHVIIEWKSPTDDKVWSRQGKRYWQLYIDNARRVYDALKVAGMAPGKEKQDANLG